MTDISKNTPFYYSLSGDTEEDKKLLEPVQYISCCVKRHVCTKLTLAFNHWFKISSDRLQQIDEIINIVFYVCVLFDDIQDNAILREGSPVVHSIYGLSNTINAANYVQFIAFEKIVNLHPTAVKILIEQLLEYKRGQGMETYWKEYFICPTEEDYKIMAIRNSSWIVKLAVRLMKLFSTYEGDLSSLINVMGFFYQIHDDYSNLCLCKDINDKSYCDDLTEGKFSFPIIHALRSNPDDHQIINILKQRTTNIELKRYCVELLENSGSLKYTRDVLQKLNKKMRLKIEHLGGNPLLLKLVDGYKIPNSHAAGPKNEIKN